LFIARSSAAVVSFIVIIFGLLKDLNVKSIWRRKS
jgi:hypothetical protein